MAVHNALFVNAAKAAFLGATQMGRMNLSAVQSDYAPLCLTATAFANSVDQAIPAIGGGGATQSQADMVLCICQGQLATREPMSHTQTDYDVIAAAIAACYAQSQV